MNKPCVIPKEDRPKAVERILRESRAANPGTWIPWKDILSAVGGSKRDLSPMIRAAKDRILAEEAATAHLPELPAEMQSECKRFVMQMWQKSCEINDANALAERRRRQADRERWDEERCEHDEVVAALVDERDRLLAQVQAYEATLEERAVECAAKDAALVEERRLRSAAEAASNELRKLFESMRGVVLDSDHHSAQTETDDAKPKSAPNRGSRKTASPKAPSEPEHGNDDDPEAPPLPFG